MLKFKEFVSWLSESEINEANVWRNRSAIYIPHPNTDTKWPSDLLNLTFIYDDRNVDTLESPRFFMVPKSGKIVELSKTQAKYDLKNPKVSLMSTEIESNNYLIVFPDTKLLIQSKRSGETTTNVKEGMVVYFYYSDINTCPDERTARTIISDLLNLKIPEESLDEKSIKEVNDYLYNLSINKKTISDLIDFWSSANLLKNKVGSYLISRNYIFNRIRKLGSKITNFPPDKWCPGDIYLINPSSIEKINEWLSSIEKNIQEDSVAKLNLLFNDELAPSTLTSENPIQGSIIAISLKKEKAQAGKAKQFLKSLSKDEKEYNVTKEELNISDEELIKKIEYCREKISELVPKSITTINLIQDRNFVGNSDKIKSKYASIKLAYRLLQDPSLIDDNILKSVAFGMSLTGINPTFFKVVGNPKGIAKFEKFPNGDMIYLMDGGLNNKNSNIEIIDLNSNTSISFKLKIKKGEEEKFIHLKCKPNGNTQSTLEIEKA
jgi:hypothetical protein